MNEFYEVYDRYRHRFKLYSRIRTNISGDNKIQIWQRLSIKDEKLIVDVSAENVEDLYRIAAHQLQAFFNIFTKGVTVI